MLSSELPDILPIFPLRGALLLPRGQLPLNVFEPRYIALIDAALQADRLIGMIQPRGDLETETGVDDAPIYEMGCAGRITGFTETTDGRYEITLKGICRFEVKQELLLENGFRRVEPNWRPFRSDIQPQECWGLDRKKLVELLEPYFEKQGMSCSWDSIDTAPDERLITCLSMACPLDAQEKQALLEAKSCRERAKMFMAMLDFAVQDCDCSSGH